jgi:hypothetical protein
MVGGEGGSTWVPWAVLGSDGLRFDRFTNVGESLTSTLINQNSHLTMAQDVDVDLLREPRAATTQATPRLLS